MIDPPRDFSLMPFWFWNDDLSETEIVRQIADFEAHGVHGFVIHPRVGLPRHLGWMSDALLQFMEIAILEAKSRDMKVILYDEGMYPSGSSSGQVVAENPDYACRCLAALELGFNESHALKPDEHLIGEFNLANGKRMIVFDRKADAYIRGLHFIGDGPAEDEPPMADILNPGAVQTLIRLVYERFAERFGAHFGKTVIGIFTDEPNALGKCRETNVWPGTTGILEYVSLALGYDFTPCLPALWLDDDPDAKKRRSDYRWAVQRRLEKTWYQSLSDWCRAHRIALCGHPANGDEIGVQRYFDIPGQDLVWRFVEPGKPSSLEGPESTQGKCSSSAMIHLGSLRNSNEFCGAYGPQTTFEEMKGLADWCMVRGVNLLIPHAFYYSVRGPRRDERPPQLGPNSPWWDRFKPFADHCRRLSWINTDCQHICDIAILTNSDHCPWRAAKVCFENQRDFNYLEASLLEKAKIGSNGIEIAGMHYKALIIDGDDERPRPLMEAPMPMVIPFAGPTQLLEAIDRLCAADITLPHPAPNLRYRHVIKSQRHYYIFLNEADQPLKTPVEIGATGARCWIDTATGFESGCDGQLILDLPAFGVALLGIS